MCLVCMAASQGRGSQPAHEFPCQMACPVAVVFLLGPSVRWCNPSRAVMLGPGGQSSASRQLEASTRGALRGSLRRIGSQISICWNLLPCSWRVPRPLVPERTAFTFKESTTDPRVSQPEPHASSPSALSRRAGLKWEVAAF